MSEREFMCRVPEALVDGDWRGFWRAAVEMGGGEPVGEPDLQRHDPATIDGEQIDPDARTIYTARGPARRLT